MRARINYQDVVTYMREQENKNRRLARKEERDKESVSQAKKAMVNPQKQQSKYMRIREAKEYYCFGITTIRKLAKEAGATIHIGKCLLIDTEIFENYIDSFRDE